MGKTKHIALGLFGLIYLLNPGAGIFEFIPDAIPYIGNLDEGLATLLLVNAFKHFKSKK